MVNTRTDAELTAAVWNALQTLLPQIHAEIREEFRTGSGPSGSGGNPPPIFEVMGCEDAFKTRLAVYKFEGNALAWWKAYKQAKGGDAWLITIISALQARTLLSNGYEGFLATIHDTTSGVPSIHDQPIVSE
nr:hypothetical protein [Tanacetum cinerariifolium]